MTQHLRSLVLLTCAFLTLIAANALAATPVATYEFDHDFSANEASVPDLSPTDPLGTSAFVADTVFGEPRTVWSFDGNANPIEEQAGLTVDTSGLISPTGYSVDMVFLFTEQENGWRRIIDVENRESDSGFYVDPTNNLHIFPETGSTAAFSNNEYHHVVLTNDGDSVSGYIDGVAQFTATTSVMQIANGNNLDELMHFFVDNIVGGGAFEFSDGRVALIRLWDGVLTPEEAQQIASHPFTIPEPSSAACFAIGAVLVGFRRRVG